MVNATYSHIDLISKCSRLKIDCQSKDEGDGGKYLNNTSVASCPRDSAASHCELHTPLQPQPSTFWVIHNLQRLLLESYIRDYYTVALSSYGLI